MRQILVCLCGLSPAVVTEAAYALAVRARPRVVPDEIYIVTTGDALPVVTRTLLGPDGAIRRLVREYGLPPQALACDLNRVVVLRGSSGQVLHDIRTSADSRVAGEQIAALLRRLRRDAAVELHCSLAGGRKTMGALLACALQLVARQGDRLYHVLVDARFEGQPWFYYPPRRSLRRRVNGQVLDARLATVHLAEIPIVRLGSVAEALAVRGDLATRVAQVEAAMDERFTPPPLELRPRDASLVAGDVALRLPSQDFALYALYASLRARCRSCARTRRRGCPGCQPSDDEIFDRHRGELAGWWAQARVRRAPGFERLLGARQDDGGALVDFRDWLRQSRSRIARRLASAGATFAWELAYGIAGDRRGRGLKLWPHLIVLRLPGEAAARGDRLARLAAGERSGRRGRSR